MCLTFSPSAASWSLRSAFLSGIIHVSGEERASDFTNGVGKKKNMSLWSFLYITNTIIVNVIVIIIIMFISVIIALCLSLLPLPLLIKVMSSIISSLYHYHYQCISSYKPNLQIHSSLCVTNFLNYKCVQIEAVGIARQELFNLELTIPIFSAREISGIDSEMASSVLVLVPEREVMRWSVVMCWSVSRSFVFCVKMKLIRVSHLFKIVAW